MKLYKGNVVAVTTGDYEDYVFDGVVKVKKSFIVETLRGEFLQYYPEFTIRDRFDAVRFIKWLINLGYLVAVNVPFELNIDEYNGRIKISKLPAWGDRD
jgi:hypothetical protein